MKRVIFILLGVLFGIVMYKAEAASWFRIYEMFKFQSFHMYGFIGSALVVGVIGIQLFKRFGTKTIEGGDLELKPKDKTVPRYLIGGIFFGLGWALVGACPGPLFVLLGTGLFSIGIVIIGALIGTYIYGVVRSKLPH
ncbi:YeeE/YedE family protein [Sphingobacterium rhinopitheci]|nr:YeeE/YedE family protein [Sphingobacterium rhinopitheci]